jgi:transcriptional regulator with XRE-family HTH domain
MYSYCTLCAQNKSRTFCSSPLPKALSLVHPVYMSKKSATQVTTRFKGGPRYRLTYIRQWRKAKSMTLEALAERVGEKVGGMTHASLSRIERGLQPYSQPILEAIADELTGGDVGSLLMRDPSDPNAIWSIWERAKPGERKMIVDIANTILKTGT